MVLPSSPLPVKKGAESTLPHPSLDMMPTAKICSEALISERTVKRNHTSRQGFLHVLPRIPVHFQAIKWDGKEFMTHWQATGLELRISFQYSQGCGKLSGLTFVSLKMLLYQGNHVALSCSTRPLVPPSTSLRVIFPTSPAISQ